MTSTTAEWLLEISGLTVGTQGGEDVVAQAHHLAAQIRSAAAAYRSATTCEARDALVHTCPLGAVGGGPAACHLAGLLAPDAHRVDSVDGARAARRYVQALRAATPAVFTCRRQAHPAGECWFTPGGGDPLCGDVLAVAHRMG